MELCGSSIQRKLHAQTLHEPLIPLRFAWVPNLLNSNPHMNKSNKPWPSVPCSSSQSSPSGGAEGAKNHTGTDGETENDLTTDLDHRDIPASVETLLPYETSLPFRGRGRRKRGKLTPRTWKTPDSNNLTEIEFPRHFIIKSVEDVNLSTIDTITAHRELLHALNGEPKSITETASGALLIQVETRLQSENIQKITSLANTTVSVAPNNSMNKSKGVIRFENKPQFSEQQILSGLKKHKVSEVYQLTKRSDNSNNNRTQMPLFVLTFDTVKLPDRVQIGWTSCQVRQYIPRPRRCYKCQRYGHGATNCRSLDATCVNCGLPAHGECHEGPRCANCGGEHPASATDCPTYRYEEEIIATKTKENITFREAKEMVAKRFVRPRRPYAQALQQPRPQQKRQPANVKRSDTQTSSRPSQDPPSSHQTWNTVSKNNNSRISWSHQPATPTYTEINNNYALLNDETNSFNDPTNSCDEAPSVRKRSLQVSPSDHSHPKKTCSHDPAWKPRPEILHPFPANLMPPPPPPPPPP